MGHGMIPTSLVPSPPPQLSSFTVLHVMMTVEYGLGTRLATLPTCTTSRASVLHNDVAFNSLNLFGVSEAVVTKIS